MKVLHISTSDILGGAAIAANRLNSAMLNNGIDSEMFILNKYSLRQCNGIHIASPWFRKIIASINVAVEKLLIKSSEQYGKFSFPLFGTTPKTLVENADVVYIHWINSGFLGWKSFEKILCSNKKIFIVLHDMWYMTGGCHHSFSCLKYQLKCEKCPMITKKTFSFDFALYEFTRKSRLYLKHSDNVTFVTPSKWLTSCALQSFLLHEKPILTIPNLVDINLYKPIDNSDNIKKYIIGGTSKKVIAFCAESGINNPYKGFKYLEEAICILENKYIDSEKLTLLIIGSKNSDIQKKIKTECVFIDRIVDDISMSFLFNSMDVFVSPSLAEAFGQTLLEAISCGTPVVGFNVGGIPDIIQHGYNGYLAGYCNSEELAFYIYQTLTAPDNSLKKNARVSALNFSSDNIVKKHVEAWKSK